MPTKTGQPTKNEKQKMREKHNERIKAMIAKDRDTPAKGLADVLGKWTYSDIAKACGVTVASISYIFNLDRWPRLPLGVKIARFLGISAEELCQSLLVARKKAERNERDAKRRRADARAAKKAAA